MGCLIGMPKKRIIVENKLKTKRKTNKSPSQKNKTKQKRAELERFLKTEKTSSNWFKGKQIKFNPKVFSRHDKKNNLSFHLDTVKKIDTLLTELEKDTKQHKKQKTTRTTFGLAEIREPLRRKTISSLETEPDFISEIDDPDEGLFPTRPHRGLMPQFRFVKKFKETPDIVFIKKDDHIKDENFHTHMIGDKDVQSQKHFMGFANIKFRNKDEKTKQEKKTASNDETKATTNLGTNGVAKTKKALEETKKEIEEKKKELEQAKQEAKQKEEELIKKMIEKEKKKKEEEKLKKLEMKKAEIEAKREERELKKKAKIEEKKKKLEAKMALKEEKLKQKKLKEKKRELEKHKEKTSDTLKVTDKEPKEMRHFISSKKETIEVNPLLDDDVRKVLIITDNLLEKLPEDVIDDFVKSKDFGLYEKVISKYKIK